MERPDSELVPDGYVVFRWPEFQALMARMGVPEGVYTRGLTISVYEGRCPTVTHEYIASDTTKLRPVYPKIIDTTTVHNEAIRTSEPSDLSKVGPPIITHIVLGGEG